MGDQGIAKNNDEYNSRAVSRFNTVRAWRQTFHDRRGTYRRGERVGIGLRLVQETRDRGGEIGF